jgi:glycosyltransferase involved in cell wall biosynthesis
VEQLGLEERVIFAGHRSDDYPALLREMELLTFLVPGSDGSCRAVLEAAACGVPAVVSRRGALPEIVLDGESGRLVDERADSLAAAWRELLDRPEALRRMGDRARRRALEVFDPRRLASEVLSLYEAC